MKKMTIVCLLFLVQSTYADVSLRELILAKKANYTIGANCIKGMVDSPKIFQRDEIKNALLDMGSMKFDDHYFFHYTDTVQVPFMLHSDMRNRSDAHKKIKIEGGYREILEYQMIYPDALSNASGVGLYLSANPFSSQNYGSIQLSFKIDPKAKVLDRTSSNTNSIFNDVYRKIVAENNLISNCSSKLIESLIYDENGVDLVYFNLSSEWVVLFNEDVIQSSEIISLNNKSQASVIDAMLVNGSFEPLLPYFDPNSLSKSKNYNFSLDWVLDRVSTGKIEHTYVFIDPTKDSDVTKLAKVITAKDKMTFDRHVNHLDSLNVNYEAAFLNVEFAVFSKGNANYFKLVVDAIKKNPSLLETMTNMQEKLHYMSQREILPFSVILAAKPNITTTNKLLEMFERYGTNLLRIDRMELLEYAFNNFPSSILTLPEHKYLNYQNTYLTLVLNLEEARICINSIKKVNHPKANVLAHIFRYIQSGVKDSVVNHYLNRSLVQEDVSSNLSNISAYLIRLEDYKTFELLLRSNLFSDAQKSAIYRDFSRYFMNNSLSLIVNSKLVQSLPESLLIELDKQYFMSGNLELLKNYFYLRKTPAYTFLATALKSNSGPVSQETASFFFSEIEKKPNLLKDLREGKDGTSFEFFLKSDFPELNKYILHKYKADSIIFIEKNYRQLPYSYRVDAVNFSYSGELFKTLPGNIQLDFVKSNFQIMGIENFEKYLLHMSLNQSQAGDLIRFLILSENTEVLLSLVEVGHGILINSSIDDFNNLFLKISDARGLIDVKEKLLRSIDADKKVILLWNHYNSLSTKTISSLTGSLLKSYSSLPYETKKLMALSFNGHWESESHQELQDTFYLLLLDDLSINSDIQLWAPEAHLMDGEKFLAFFDKVLSGKVNFNTIYALSGHSHDVLMNRVLSELSGAQVQVVVEELRVHYPVRNAIYTKTFFEFLENAPDVQDRDLKLGIVQTHTKENLCKKINKFIALSVATKNADKVEKKWFKSVSKVHCKK